MELILLRHGKAENINLQGDSARELVGKGRLQARKAAAALKRAGLLPEIVHPAADRLLTGILELMPEEPLEAPH